MHKPEIPLQLTTQWSHSFVDFPPQTKPTQTEQAFQGFPRVAEKGKFLLRLDTTQTQTVNGLLLGNDIVYDRQGKVRLENRSSMIIE